MKISKLGSSLLLALSLSVTAAPLLAADDTDSAAQEQTQEQAGDQQASEGMTYEQFMQSLHFRSGLVEIPQAKAHFNLDSQFRFLDQTDARRVLEDMWGNPPDESVLGLIVPRSPELGEDGSWAVAVTFSDDGYVSDEDAANIDYDEMLKSMQEATHDANEERSKQGYATAELVGWAVPPSYDQDSKKLYWAKELDFSGEPEHTLNYDIRVLGRHGYLSLNAIASMSTLPQVREDMQKLLPMTSFDEGARYADHNAATDKVASYGLAALIGGGLAAKAGLFAKLGLLLAKGWKLVIVAGVAIVAGIKKLFGRGKNNTVR